MLRRLQALLVLSVATVPAVAAAQEAAEDGPEEATETPTSDTPVPAPGHRVPTPAAVKAAPAEAVTLPAAPAPAPEAKPEGLLSAWKFELNGYFRAPMALGISSRPDPVVQDVPDPTDPAGKRKMPNGPSHTQVSYGPNRVLDWSYYSFAYTRLQEQDWAELLVHARRKHVDAALGWMGYWLSAAGFRNPDAAAVPGIAYLALDTDIFEVPGVVKPNIALTMGAWWPGYGYFEKYDTFTLSRYRQMGAQLKLAVPIIPADLTITHVEGFGTGRDGKFGYTDANTTPLYAGFTTADLIYYAHLQFTWGKRLDVGLHYNYSWVRDPNLFARGGAGTGKSFADARAAHLSVTGLEAGVNIPYAGRLWISPSYVSVKNGWALGGAGGIEVMHSQNGLGIATNYMAYTGAPTDGSTGTGSMVNCGFLFEYSLHKQWSDIWGETAPSWIPEVKVSGFGLLALASIDLPTLPEGQTSLITQDKIKQLKWGVDATVQPLTWLGVMARYDSINYNMDKGGYIFSAITGRLAISSHFLSGESIYLQYSRYFYGDRMVIAGTWPWNTDLVAGSGPVQGNSGYSRKKPDENVIKLQAQISF